MKNLSGRPVAVRGCGNCFVKSPWGTAGLAMIAVAVLASLQPAMAAPADSPRQVVSLDGTWQVAQGSLAQRPAKFDHQVPVPGLVDLATPPFVDPGPKVAQRTSLEQSSDPRRQAFWYRRTFDLAGPIPQFARLEIAKAKYGTKVWINGRDVGEHLPCFTPGWFDVRKVLKTGTNEIVVRVGASRDQLHYRVADGFDFEKTRYIPGIYDSVRLILAGSPYISNVQIAPDIAHDRARVRVYLQDAQPGDVTVEIREAKSGKVVGHGVARIAADVAGATQTVDAVVKIFPCHLWSPADPFLYKVIVSTAGDEYTTRFGMREFHFDPKTGRAMLNGKPYFMRGSNITIYRFFEDRDCDRLPWDPTWVRTLMQRVKNMHWNCLRFCIGFPPELWYRIADEEGILVQDEFPIWYGGAWWNKWPPQLKTADLVTEYGEWMRDRWNHPCVVIWDASNETTSSQTWPAIAKVRSLDLSNRPWDNGYMPPARPGDVVVEHPYHFSNPNFKLSMLAQANPAPWGQRGKGHGVIINEYGYLWLNRDGTPTTLTSKVYRNLLGPHSTTQQRRRLYARYMAAETEFWRSHRTAAAVMQFTALGYSRPDGQTSDNWLNVKKLIWEPEWYKYVRDAFAPVGVCIDAWAATYPKGKTQDFPVVVINDPGTPWNGQVRFRITHEGKTITEQKLPARVAAYGTSRLVFRARIPQEPGQYEAQATLMKTPCGAVSSFRDFAVLSPQEIAARDGIAVGKHVVASSNLCKDGATSPQAAVDGNLATRWSSQFSDPQWLAVDLGAATRISRVQLVWERAYGKSYSIQVSNDGKTWTDVYTTKAGRGGTETIRFAPVEARWVRLFGTKRATPFGYSLYEFRVFP